MQPLRTKKNYATSRDKKKSRNLLGQKLFTQALKKKSCNLSGQIKNHPTSWDKKNHATSWDKNNHATTWDKKIMQPLETKKSRNLWDKKIMQPLRTTKIMLPIGTIASKLVHKAPNGSKLVKAFPKGTK